MIYKVQLKKIKPECLLMIRCLDKRFLYVNEWVSWKAMKKCHPYICCSVCMEEKNLLSSSCLLLRYYIAGILDRKLIQLKELSKQNKPLIWYHWKQHKTWMLGLHYLNSGRTTELCGLHWFFCYLLGLVPVSALKQALKREKNKSMISKCRQICL